ncbi:MAG TPA: cupredoxin domain-containing protein [Thermomicrobiales bacterium]|nr:cupredoxin domain-containing protein [Thermomicrobiales bacterium]
MPRKSLLASLALVVTLVLGLAACTGSASDNDPSGAAASAIADGAIQVELKDTMKFEPSTLTVHAGEDVVVLLKNTGAIPHNFTIEAAGIDVTLDPKKSETVEFTAPADPGEYDIACTEPGHENAGMTGTLIVER